MIKNLNTLNPAVRAQLAEQVDAKDVGAGAHVAKVIANTVANNRDSLPGASFKNPYAAPSLLAKRLLDSGAVQDLANQAVMLEASQRLERADRIYGDFSSQIDRSFGVGKASSVKAPTVAKLAGVLSGPSGDLAATLSAQLQHQTYVATSSTWGVDLQTHPEALKPGFEGRLKVGKDGLTTRYDVAGRSGLEDWSVLRDEARASANDAGKQPYRRALEDARRGTAAAQQAVVHYLQNGAVPTPQNARLAAQTLTDPLQQAAPAILMDQDTRDAVKSLGRELSAALRAFDEARPQTAEQAKVLWDQFPSARGFAETEQLFWLQYDLGKTENQKTGKGARKFDEIGPENQVQNLRSTVVTLLGMLDADELLRGVMSGRQKLTPELGELLQTHLNQASQQAIQAANGQGDYALASTVHARAMATQQFVQVVAFAQEAFGKSYTEEQANEIFKVLYRSAKESGDKYGQGGPEGGASGASKIAVKYIGEFLATLFPGDNRDFGAYGTKLLNDSSFGTEVQMMHALGVPYEGDGTSLKRAIGEAYKDNWGIDDILRIPAQGRKFDANEVLGFFAINTLLNNTWGSQQAGRAIEETAAGKDDSRTDSAKRGGVYQPYIFMLRGLNNSVETGLRIAQDHMEAGKKAGTLPEKNDLA